MRRLLSALTVRGKSFVAAGLAAAFCGLLIPEPDLLRIGCLLMALPLLSAFGAGRARYRLSCVRLLAPPRLPAGADRRGDHPAGERLPAADRAAALPGHRAPTRSAAGRGSCCEGIAGGGSREFKYQLGSDTRGKYTVGPLQVRVADSFGLVSISRAFSSTSTLTVTPRIVALSRPPLSGNWLGDSEHGKRSISANGEDDVAPREYRTGDGLHRVHWRSTARYGELMVRREEQHWRNTASLFLDSRRSAYATSMFELAVTAAASIGVHLAGEGFEARFVTDAGEVPRQGTFGDTLLDTLAVIGPSRSIGLGQGIQALSVEGGQIIAVVGLLTDAEATELAATRRGTAPGLALLLAPADRVWAARTAATSQLLIGAGWRVATVPDGARLAAAWQELHQAGGAAMAFAGGLTEAGGAGGANGADGADGPTRPERRPASRGWPMASHRRTIAAAAATILTSISLYPVFIGTAWFWAGAGAVLAVAGAGTLTRLRRLPVPVCVVGALAGLLLYLNLVFSNGRSWWHLLPTATSLRLLWDLAGQGFHESSKYAPPVPALSGMVLLAAAGIGITAVLTDLIAVRLGSAALAGLPLLLLFTEPFTLSISRDALGTTIAFCAATAGYLWMLSSEGRDRIREWEHKDPDPRLMPDTTAVAAAGRRVGAASVVVALCVPLIIPGLHMTRLFGSGQPGIGGHGAGAGGGAGFPDPNTQMSNELHTTQAQVVFSYTSTAINPQYFQVYVLDNLTVTQGWKIFGQPSVTGDGEPAATRRPRPRGLGEQLVREGDHARHAERIGPPGPVQRAARAVSGDSGHRGWQPAGRQVEPDGVRQRPAAGRPQLLGEEPRRGTGREGPQRRRRPLGRHQLLHAGPLALPALHGLAQSVVKAAGAKTAFQDAVALQDWLSAGGGFRYTLNAPTVISESGLANFLEHTKRGYCQQFSFAMAALARLLGIPARVAIGFTSGTPVAGSQWVVTSHDAHAWPELYFQGFGWLRFEPTPPGSAPGQGTATAPVYTFSASGTLPGSSAGSQQGGAPGTSGAAVEPQPGTQEPAGLPDRRRRRRRGQRRRRREPVGGARVLRPRAGGDRGCRAWRRPAADQAAALAGARGPRGRRAGARGLA